MKRALILAVAATASVLAVTSTASARLGMAPLAAESDVVIQVKHGGHGHGHWGHHNRGHHYGWSRGRHRGWSHHHRHH